MINKTEVLKISEKYNVGLENNFSCRQKSIVMCVLLFTFSFCFAVPLFAQEDQQVTAPPPLKTISKEEKTQLVAQPDVKKHTKLALELMSARLTNAENFNNQQQYTQMFDELGGFHALVDGTLSYLSSHDTDSGKVLNNFKRLEMSLRQFTPRLELIRRDLPIKYEFYVRSLIIYLRKARTKAVEPLFDNSIVSDIDVKKPDDDY